MFNLKSVVLFFLEAFASRTSMSHVALASHWFICSCGFLVLTFALTSCFSMHICLPGFLCLFVCPLKFAVKLFLLSNFSSTYTETSMTQNFRSNGFVSTAEMPFMQSIHKTLLSIILFCCLISKISYGCHELKIYTSVIPWQWLATR